MTSPDPVARYLRLGLQLGRHLDGLVDAYYGPPELAAEAGAGAPAPLPALVAGVAELIADLDAGVGAPDLSPERRRWMRAQLVGLHLVGRKLDGEEIGYVEEVQTCYGVTPTMVPEDVLAEAHAALEDALPGSGELRDRYMAWRDTHAIPPDRLPAVIDSLRADLRERTDRLFGLPDGEHVDFELVTDQPWSGFNYYLGDLHSRVAINTDLPVLSTSIAHLVAHEAYPGHHTEHTRKEVGMVRRSGHLEETIFLVGTPQCLLAEGLADLGLEVVVGPRPEPVVAEHLGPLGVRYDAEVVERLSVAGERLAAVRGNAALLLHDEGRDADEVVTYLARWSLLDEARARKAVQFLTDPTWRAYISCYVEGLPLCRAFTAGNPANFDRLLSEHLLPEDLTAA